MKKQKKIKYIKLPMKFNPGTQKYEPVLPVKKMNTEKILNPKLKILNTMLFKDGY